uniref:SOCS box domain-containing protein n=1 Tax=Strigamia maritima TaxID=126957 RepID=T1IVR9_STRMM
MVTLGELSCFVADPDECDSIKLHQAAVNGNIVILQELLKDEENVKNIDMRSPPFGTTPLRLAATSGEVECAKLLLDNGADVNATDFKAQTPLFLAIKNNQIECADLLLQYGANPNGDDRNSTTPLYTASQLGLAIAVELLIKYGALTEINHRLVCGLPGSPLHIAIVYKHLSCFRTLLLGGAEPNMENLRPMLPQAIISRLSFPHTMTRHQCSKEFVYLFRIFGGNLWQRDGNNQLATELENNETNAYIAELMSRPLSLTNHCRIAIRRFLTRQRLIFIPNLPLPSSLLAFLQYKELKI